jgi:hypothetical protein
MRKKQWKYGKPWFLLALATWLVASSTHSQIRYTRWMIQAAVGPSSDGEWVLSGAGYWAGYGKWGLRAEVRDWKYLARTTPSDYQPGICVWGDCSPRDHIGSYSAMLSKQWTLKPYWLEAGLDAGPSVLFRRELRFQANATQGMFESNYLQSAHTSLGAAATSRAHLDWYPSRYWGCSLGINTLFDKTFRMAFDFAIQFGYTRFKGRR